MRAYFFAGRASVLSLILASMVPWSATTAQTGTAIAVEGGAVWQSRNTARIPNSDAGTRFSLRDLQGGGAEAYFRVDGTWQFGERHQLRALYAPYAITRSGIPDTALQFDGTTFAAGEPTEVHYQFDSYRLSYRYRFHNGDDWTWWGGATLKVRDASIRLRQAGTMDELYLRWFPVGFY